jgi:hypothetical protein
MKQGWVLMETIEIVSPNGFYGFPHPWAGLSELSGEPRSPDPRLLEPPGSTHPTRLPHPTPFPEQVKITFRSSRLKPRRLSSFFGSEW